MLRKSLKRLFSKISVSDIKKLRAMTAAPMSDCKKALVEAENDMSKAKSILIEKNLAKANKKDGREQKEGLWGFLSNEERTKAVMVNLTCETDFVAKSQDFIQFCESSLEILLSSQEQLDSAGEDGQLKSWLDSVEFAEGSSMLQAKKMLIANTEENIEFSRILNLSVEDDNTLIGHYVHKTITNTVGSSGCFVMLDTEGNRDRPAVALGDNLAVHCFGMKPKYLYEKEIPREIYDVEYAQVEKQMEKAVKGKPEEIKERILRGKFMKFLEGQEVMEYQKLGFVDSDETIGEYIADFQERNGYNVTIKSFGEFE